MARKPAAPRDEIRRDRSGALDEVVVAHPDFFHLEAMSEQTWCLVLSKKGKDLHVWIHGDHKGHLSVEVTENELGAAEVTTDQRPS